MIRMSQHRCSQERILFVLAVSCQGADMPADAVALGARITELRVASGLSRASAARRAGIQPGYLHAIEKVTPSTRTGVPTIPSVPVLRAIADAIDGDRAELLELAGYDDDAAFDRARSQRRELEERKPAALSGKLAELSPEDFAQIEALVDRLLDDR